MTNNIPRGVPAPRSPQINENQERNADAPAPDNGDHAVFEEMTIGDDSHQGSGGEGEGESAQEQDLDSPNHFAGLIVPRTPPRERARAKPLQNLVVGDADAGGDNGEGANSVFTKVQGQGNQGGGGGENPDEQGGDPWDEQLHLLQNAPVAPLDGGLADPENLEGDATTAEPVDMTDDIIDALLQVLTIPTTQDFNEMDISGYVAALYDLRWSEDTTLIPEIIEFMQDTIFAENPHLVEGSASQLRGIVAKLDAAVTNAEPIVFDDVKVLIDFLEAVEGTVSSGVYRSAIAALVKIEPTQERVLDKLLSVIGSNREQYSDGVISFTIRKLVNMWSQGKFNVLQPESKVDQIKASIVDSLKEIALFGGSAAGPINNPLSFDVGEVEHLTVRTSAMNALVDLKVLEQTPVDSVFIDTLNQIILADISYISQEDLTSAPIDPEAYEENAEYATSFDYLRIAAVKAMGSFQTAQANNYLLKYASGADDTFHVGDVAPEPPNAIEHSLSVVVKRAALEALKDDYKTLDYVDQITAIATDANADFKVRTKAMDVLRYYLQRAPKVDRVNASGRDFIDNDKLNTIKQGLIGVLQSLEFVANPLPLDAVSVFIRDFLNDPNNSTTIDNFLNQNVDDGWSRATLEELLDELDNVEQYGGKLYADASPLQRFLEFIDSPPQVDTSEHQYAITHLVTENETRSDEFRMHALAINTLSLLDSCTEDQSFKLQLADVDVIVDLLKADTTTKDYDQSAELVKNAALKFIRNRDTVTEDMRDAIISLVDTEARAPGLETPDNVKDIAVRTLANIVDKIDIGETLNQLVGIIGQEMLPSGTRTAIYRLLGTMAEYEFKQLQSDESADVVDNEPAEPLLDQPEGQQLMPDDPLEPGDNDRSGLQGGNGWQGTLTDLQSASPNAHRIISILAYAFDSTISSPAFVTVPPYPDQQNVVQQDLDSRQTALLILHKFNDHILNSAEPEKEYGDIGKWISEFALRSAHESVNGDPLYLTELRVRAFEKFDPHFIEASVRVDGTRVRDPNLDLLNDIIRAANGPEFDTIELRVAAVSVLDEFEFLKVGGDKLDDELVRDAINVLGGVIFNYGQASGSPDSEVAFAALETLGSLAIKHQALKAQQLQQSAERNGINLDLFNRPNTQELPTMDKLHDIIQGDHYSNEIRARAVQILGENIRQSIVAATKNVLSTPAGKVWSGIYMVWVEKQSDVLLGLLTDDENRLPEAVTEAAVRAMDIDEVFKIYKPQPKDGMSVKPMQSWENSEEIRFALNSAFFELQTRIKNISISIVYKSLGEDYVVSEYDSIGNPQLEQLEPTDPGAPKNITALLTEGAIEKALELLYSYKNKSSDDEIYKAFDKVANTQIDTNLLPLHVHRARSDALNALNVYLTSLESNLIKNSEELAVKRSTLSGLPPGHFITEALEKEIAALEEERYDITVKIREISNTYLNVSNEVELKAIALHRTIESLQYQIAELESRIGQLNTAPPDPLLPELNDLKAALEVRKADLTTQLSALTLDPGFRPGEVDDSHVRDLAKVLSAAAKGLGVVKGEFNTAALDRLIELLQLNYPDNVINEALTGLSWRQYKTRGEDPVFEAVIAILNKEGISKSVQDVTMQVLTNAGLHRSDVLEELKGVILGDDDSFRNETLKMMVKAEENRENAFALFAEIIREAEVEFDQLPSVDKPDYIDDYNSGLKMMIRTLSKMGGEKVPSLVTLMINIALNDKFSPEARSWAINGMV